MSIKRSSTGGRKRKFVTIIFALATFGFVASEALPRTRRLSHKEEKKMRKGVLSAIICAPVTLMMALLIFAGGLDPAAARNLTTKDCEHRQDACYLACSSTLDAGAARANCLRQCLKNRQSCDLLVGTEIPSKSVDDPPTKPPRGNIPRPPTGGLK
jgi:hypothetical protein